MLVTVAYVLLRRSARFSAWSAGLALALFVVSVPSLAVPAGSSGEAPWTLGEPFRWIVKYRSREGWQTYSPVLTLDPEVGSVVWERPR